MLRLARVGLGVDQALFGAPLVNFLVFGHRAIGSGRNGARESGRPQWRLASQPTPTFLHPLQHHPVTLDYPTKHPR
jgi:hypothetical protein